MTLHKVFLVLVLFIVAIAPALSACEVGLTLTDATDYGTRVGRNATELVHPFTLDVAAPGSKLTVVYTYSSFLPFPGIARTCETPEACSIRHFCLRPGTYNVLAVAQCDSATSARKTLQLVVPETPLEVEIEKIEPIDGQYDVHSVLSVPPGATVQSSWLEVFPLLSDGTYGTPRQVSSHLIDALTGDKVQTAVVTCDRRVVRSAEAIVPPPPSIEVAVLDGDGQRAVIGEPAARPLRVKFTASDPSWDLTKIPAVFEVLTVPQGAAGHGVGPTDAAIGQTYTAPIDADGIASATIVVGDLAGPYVVRVQSPQSVTGSTAVFTTTAVRPDRVAIIKDTAEMSDLAATYAVSLTEPTTFHAVGLDAGGAKIGPVRCTWTANAKGNPSTRGEGTLTPVTNTRTTTFKPTRVGRLTLNAASSMKGVAAGAADLFITKLYIDVDGLFDAAAPVDEYQQFTPGSTLTGSSVPLATIRAGQRIALHVLTGESSRGKVTFTLSDVSSYAGVAMNSPIAAASAAPDLALRNAAGTAVQTITVPFSKTGDTAATLLALDYAAHGKLRVTIESGRTVYQLATLTLPSDGNDNGIADAGWRALANSSTGATNHVPDVYPVASDGDNDPVVSGLPIEGRTGDGLTVFEEYRGFVVRGEHRRLHPLRKDVFILLYPEDDPFDDRIAELPLTVHEIHPGEAVGDLGPIINPNRATIAGASQQRGIYVRLRLVPPLYRYADGSTAPADFEALGYTFQQGDDERFIDEQLASAAVVGSPNETLVADIYDEAFWHHWISYGPNGVRDTVIAPTDVHDSIAPAIHGGSNRVQSVPNSANFTGDDFHSSVINTVCGSAPGRPYRTLTPDEVLDSYLTTFLHEVAHALDVDHDRLECSPSIMSDEMADPVLRSLTPNDRSQIRVHRKHN
jgi:hypothetical protein